MKSDINNIRSNACLLLLFYRSMYSQCSNNLIVVNKAVIDNMHDHYIMLRGLYNCRLISLYTIYRAYSMYITIYERGENNANRI